MRVGSKAKKVDTLSLIQQCFRRISTNNVTVTSLTNNLRCEEYSLLRYTAVQFTDSPTFNSQPRLKAAEVT